MVLNFTSEDFVRMDRFYRVNFIHSLAGFKSPFLIGSMGQSPNLAVFSSVFHLGSNPPLLGIKFRPVTNDNHTHRNLKEKGIITINSVQKEIFHQGHLTSARLQDGQSEFEFSGLELEWREFTTVPFVKQSRIKVLAEFREEHHIKANDVIIAVVEIKWVEIQNDKIGDNGVIPLDQLDMMAINGLYTYYLPTYEDTLGYVSRPTDK